MHDVNRKAMVLTSRWWGKSGM